MRRPHLSHEWDKVMFAQACDVDVADDHHLIVVFRKYRVVDDIFSGLG
jgi:hypothetical protein